MSLRRYVDMSLEISLATVTSLFVLVIIRRFMSLEFIYTAVSFLT
jgi:hypothetical protein